MQKGLNSMLETAHMMEAWWTFFMYMDMYVLFPKVYSFLCHSISPLVKCFLHFLNMQMMNQHANLTLNQSFFTDICRKPKRD